MRKARNKWLGLVLIALFNCNDSTLKEQLLETTYFDNGSIKSEIFEIISSEKTVRKFFIKYYYRNSSLNCKYDLRQNEDNQYVTDGPYFCLYPNGDTLSIGKYSSGELIGIRRAYFRNKQLGSFEVRRPDSINENTTRDSLGNIIEYQVSYKGKYFYRCKYDSFPHISEREGDPFLFVSYSPKEMYDTLSIEGIIIHAHEPNIINRNISVIDIKNDKKQEITHKFDLERRDSLFSTYTLNAPRNTTYRFRFYQQTVSGDSIVGDTLYILHDNINQQ